MQLLNILLTFVQVSQREAFDSGLRGQLVRGGGPPPGIAVAAADGADVIGQRDDGSQRRLVGWVLRSQAGSGGRLARTERKLHLRPVKHHARLCHPAHHPR